MSPGNKVETFQPKAILHGCNEQESIAPQKTVLPKTAEVQQPVTDSLGKLETENLETKYSVCETI